MAAPIWFRIAARTFEVAIFCLLTALATAGAIFGLATIFSVVAFAVSLFVERPAFDHWFISLWWLWVALWCLGGGAYLEWRDRK